jgi:hypothetical protein
MCCSTLVLVACRGNVLDIGPGGSAAAGGSQTHGFDADAAACPSFASVEPDAGTGDLASLAGTWTGYIENYQFPSGSDVLVLALPAQDGGSASGTIVFGHGSPLPPPPTDPTVPYYPNPQNTNAIPGALLEGFPYTVIAPSLDGSRLRFSMASREPYRPWCELQTSYLWFATAPNCTFGCLPNWSGKGNGSPAGPITLTNPDGGPNMVVSSGYFALCADPSSAACDCDPTLCTVRLDRPAGPTFDMQVTAGHMDGSVVIGGGTNNVHFTGP